MCYKYGCLKLQVTVKELQACVRLKSDQYIMVQTTRYNDIHIDKTLTLLESEKLYKRIKTTDSIFIMVSFYEYNSILFYLNDYGSTEDPDVN